ncbi:hypothetical protein [Cytobacillus kochii]|nr:hypothetical protein [Cytobacillus kochii]
MKKRLKIIKDKDVHDKFEEELLRVMPEYIQVNLVKAINKYF